MSSAAELPPDDDYAVISQSSQRLTAEHILVNADREGQSLLVQAQEVGLVATQEPEGDGPVLVANFHLGKNGPNTPRASFGGRPAPA